MPGPGREREGGLDAGSGSCGATVAEPIQLGNGRKASGIRLMYGNAREVRRVLILEIETAGDTGCTACCGVGTRALVETAGKIPVLGAGKCYPRLKIAR